MKRVILALTIVGVGVTGCKKAAPTTFIKAISMYLSDPSGQSYQHQFQILSSSPNTAPTVIFNNRTVPDDRISSNFGDYYGWDTLPPISPNADVEMKVTYYNLNDEKKEASSKVKLPTEPSGMALSTSGGEVTVSWSKPDKKTTNFVYVGLTVGCTDGSITQYVSWDSAITDIENTTSVNKTLGSLCNEVNNIVYALVYAAVYNMKGPWSGAKDNIKGAKGQYYAASGKADTASYTAVKGKYNVSLPKVNWAERILNAVGEPTDEGNWIVR